MEVSFIIPLYNGLALSQRCLHTLQTTFQSGLDHEIILVDDGSTDGTREWLAGLSQPAASALHPHAISTPSPCRHLLNEANLGFAATCNRGAAAAQGNLLFFLNNDLVFQPGWLKPMLTLVRTPQAGLVGNIQLNAATGLVDHTGLWFNRKGQPVHRTDVSWPARISGRQEVPALTGACFAIKKSTWHQLGGFDEGFINGGEDVDLCLRARQAGLHNFIATRSVVRHHISQAPGRKMHDEENSRRLLTRWRSAIAWLSARDVARACLEVAWADPIRYPEPLLAGEALLHFAGVLPGASARFTAVTEAAFAIEFQRWHHLLEGGTPPTPSSDPVWQQAQQHFKSALVL